MPLVTPINLIAESEDGDRRYVHPETGEVLPRVTSVIKGFSPHSLGFTSAMRAGAARGTALHSAIEAALLGKPAALPADVVPFWNQVVPLLEQIGELYLLESPVWLAEGAAGTPDCGGMYRGLLTLFDWKTCKYATPTVWQRDYPLQVAAYIRGAKNTYDLEFERAVVAIASPHNLRLVEMDRDDIDAAFIKFQSRLDVYNTRRDAWLEQLENQQENDHADCAHQAS